VYKRLVLRGYNSSEIGRKVGKNSVHIQRCIEMASLPKAMQNKIMEGIMTGQTGVEIYKSVNENRGTYRII
jgi:ParB-like chromosome segregation protein Spo0J